MHFKKKISKSGHIGHISTLPQLTISVNNNDITSWQNVYKTLSNKLLQPSITKDTNKYLTMEIQNFHPIQIQSNDFNQISQDTIINKYNLNNDQIIMFNIYTENIFKSIKQKYAIEVATLVQV